jgi:hypothetical protein
MGIGAKNIMLQAKGGNFAARILFLIMILPGKAAPVLRDGMIPMRLLPASRLQE